MGQEQERCKVCDRVDCQTLMMPEMPRPKYDLDGDMLYIESDAKVYLTRLAATNDCDAHAVDWRRRALEAEARERWVSVEERLPEVGVDVLVTNGADMHIANMDVLYDGSVWWADCSGGPARNDTTHWRPMPAAPEVP